MYTMLPCLVANWRIKAEGPNGFTTRAACPVTRDPGALGYRTYCLGVEYIYG